MQYSYLNNALCGMVRDSINFGRKGRDNGIGILQFLTLVRFNLTT